MVQATVDNPMPTISVPTPIQVPLLLSTNELKMVQALHSYIFQRYIAFPANPKHIMSIFVAQI